MIDLSNGPVPLMYDSLSEISEQLNQDLPDGVSASVKEGNNPQIKLRQGLWRGVTLMFEKNSDQISLTGYRFMIPDFFSVVILFVISVIIFSLIITIIVSAISGEFVPAVGGVGGIAGIAMYSIIQNIVLANVKRSWSPELSPFIEKLKSGAGTVLSVSGIESENNLIPAEEFAQQKGITPEEVVEKIRDGKLAGKIDNGRWYINLELSRNLHQ